MVEYLKGDYDGNTAYPKKKRQKVVLTKQQIKDAFKRSIYSKRTSKLDKFRNKWNRDTEIINNALMEDLIYKSRRRWNFMFN